MANATLIFQRNGRLLISPGDGLDAVLRVVRQCAQLRSIVAGSYLYEISPPVIWGTAARGTTAAELIEQLERSSMTPMPSDTAALLTEMMSRFGAIELTTCGSNTFLTARSPEILRSIGVDGQADGQPKIEIDPAIAGRMKLAAIKAGWPIVDRRREGASGETLVLNQEVRLRPYQVDAVSAFQAGYDGVILLPCGAGKTLVGVAAAVSVGGPILVLVPSRAVGDQWRDAFVRATSCSPSDICWADEDTGGRLVFLATYHAATAGNVAGYLSGKHWQLVIYDEVQSLPADVFRLAATIHAHHRLGLSATLVREDGREAEVFALVGPPLYEASWLELERDGWIAPARCVEVRVPAAETPSDALRYKMAVVQRLLDRHRAAPTLVVGTHVASLQSTGKRLQFPVLTGTSSPERRTEVFDAFRRGDVPILGLSRIGSVGIDLPDASVLIQISGTYGSRQEEAQRLGRLLRPAAGKTAWFYTIVATGTREQHFATRRQRFLVNQGYIYDIIDASELSRLSRLASDVQ